MELKGIKTGRAVGKEGITVHLLNEGGDIVPKKLAKNISECLRPLKMPIAWMNANIFLTHKKENTKELKN